MAAFILVALLIVTVLYAFYLRELLASQTDAKKRAHQAITDFAVQTVAAIARRLESVADGRGLTVHSRRIPPNEPGIFGEIHNVEVRDLEGKEIVVITFMWWCLPSKPEIHYRRIYGDGYGTDVYKEVAELGLVLDLAEQLLVERYPLVAATA